MKREGSSMCSSMAVVVSTPSTLQPLNLVFGSDSEEEDRESQADDVQIQVRNEVLPYFGERNLAKEENPLQWWKANSET